VRATPSIWVIGETRGRVSSRNNLLQVYRISSQLTSINSPTYQTSKMSVSVHFLAVIVGSGTVLENDGIRCLEVCQNWCCANTEMKKDRPPAPELSPIQFGNRDRSIRTVCPDHPRRQPNRDGFSDERGEYAEFPDTNLHLVQTMRNRNMDRKHHSNIRLHQTAR